MQRHHTPASPAMAPVAVAGILGSAGGGLLDAATRAGGMWSLLLPLLTVGVTEAARRDAAASRSMAAMNCATLGGVAGAIMAYAASHALAGLEATHAIAHMDGLQATSGGALAHFQTLHVYLMNGGMGAMLGASVMGCPWIRLPRTEGLRLRLPRIAWVRW